MKIRVGDWVQCVITGTVARVNEIHDSKSSPPHLYILSNGHTYGPSDISPLYVPDAFALAGAPVPAGARIVRYENSLWCFAIGNWDYDADATEDNFGAFHEDFWELSSMKPRFTPAFSSLYSIAQNRTPIADAWECLPLFVREKLEGYLQEKQK